MDRNEIELSRRPLMLAAAKKRQLSGVDYHYDREQCINVIDGSTTPVVAVASHLLKTQGYAEDIG